jgi:DNA-binding transcriptional MerR regulator
MADVHESGYLSIGEVLGLLLEEFPDITISKIRFLESQGLISPERTASGYRKFYDDDVELLRVILTEQRQNYLPLRVIKTRLESGEIDPTGENLRPDSETPDDGVATTGGSDADDESELGPEHDEAADVPAAAVSSHPASRVQQSPDHPSRQVAPAAAGPSTNAPAQVTTDEVVASDVAESVANVADTAGMLQGVLLDRAEFCGMVGMTEGELSELESFGIVAARDGSGIPLYGDEAVEIAKPACEFLRAGVDARHLRNWRTSAEREASLYEQLVTPRFRQRNPEARAEALRELRRLDELGATLRAAMTRHALRHHFET